MNISKSRASDKMSSARLRVPADDSRSETSTVITTLKERNRNGSVISKPRKKTQTGANESNSVFQVAVNGALTAANSMPNGVKESDAGLPQTDWNSMPVSTLHTYRSAYRIPIQSSHTLPHADLIYNSSETAMRAPSAVRARRQLRELHAHRRKKVYTNDNGVSKSVRRTSKDKQRDDNVYPAWKKQKDSMQVDENTIAQSIEPPSPTVQSLSTSSDQASSSLLNTMNPESTLIGRASPSLLAMTVRKHFNAQQLNEVETIARFTYVVRQLGYGNSPLPTSNNSINTPSAPGATTPIRVEGSEGDGSGWIMGSMGRQVRIGDSGGGGAFRLRFRP